MTHSALRSISAGDACVPGRDAEPPGGALVPAWHDAAWVAAGSLPDEEVEAVSRQQAWGEEGVQSRQEAA